MADTKGNSQRSRRSSSGSSRRRAKEVTVNPAPGHGEGTLEEDLSALMDGSTAAAQQPICSVALCPICMVVTAVGEARPELVQHLLLASREVLLAVRSIIDARLEGSEQPSKLERIKVE